MGQARGVAGVPADALCTNAHLARLERHSISLLFLFRDMLNYNKATLPLGSHRNVQCVPALELAPSVLGSSVHITAGESKSRGYRTFCAFARDLRVSVISVFQKFLDISTP